jgi:hypothetical protein
VRQIGSAVTEQVHRHERQIADHVDPAEVVVELDAVEDSGLAFDLRHVAQVQVAVALADPAVAVALHEHRLEGGARSGLPGLQ